MSALVHTVGTASATAFSSLRELRDHLLADETVPDQRRRDLASALKTFAKAVDRPIDVLPADPALLKPLLKGITPAMIGLKPGRWKNVLSLVNAALAHVGLVVVAGRIRTKPSPAWEAVLDLLPDAHGDRFHLGRFARYCTARSIEPAQVTDATIVRYQADLASGSLTVDHLRAPREVARAWNKVGETHSGWPQARLTIPDNRNTYSLPWCDYPASLKIDVDLWLERLGSDSHLFDRDFDPLRPASIATRSRQIRLYLAALVLKGVPAIELVDLKAAVRPEAAAKALRMFWDRANGKPNHHGYQIATLVGDIARHWAKLPARDLDALRNIASRLRPKVTGMTERNRKRLRQLEDPERLHALLALPDRLLTDIRRLGAPTVELARQVQTAAAIQILVHTAMRFRNLRELRLDERLVRHGDGSITVIVHCDDVKNEVPIERRLPPQAARVIAVYIDLYRPLLAGGGSAWLFPGADPADPKSDEGMRKPIQKTIAERAGLEWNPHLFRHSAAFLILRENPTAYGTVQRLLGHKSIQTTIAIYSGMETGAAHRFFDDLVGRLLDEEGSDGIKQVTQKRGGRR